MQKHTTFDDVTLITPTAAMSPAVHGNRAKCLQRLVRLDMPVPTTVALSFEAVTKIAGGVMPDMAQIMAPFGDAPLLSVRPSSQSPDWGGPAAVLNIGMNDARLEVMKEEVGESAAIALYAKFLHSYAIEVARLDPEAFTLPAKPTEADLRKALESYEFEADEPFPQNPVRQLEEVLRSMARAWTSTTARLLREANGAPADAGLGLVVQKMALGVGRDGECGSGVIQYVDSDTGKRQLVGRYLGQSQGREALGDVEGAMFLTKDQRGPSLDCLLYTSPSPRDGATSRMPSSA